jgi:hypothetical protein
MTSWSNIKIILIGEPSLIGTCETSNSNSYLKVYNSDSVPEQTRTCVSSSGGTVCVPSKEPTDIRNCPKTPTNKLIIYNPKIDCHDTEFPGGSSSKCYYNFNRMLCGDINASFYEYKSIKPEVVSWNPKDIKLDPPIIVCTLKYFYDYTDYNFTSMQNNTGGTLKRWLMDLYQNTSNVPLNDSMIYYLRDKNIIYSSVLDYYNQLYKTGFYRKNIFPIPPFLYNNFVCLSTDFTDSFFNNYYKDLHSIFTKSIFPETFSTLIKQNLTFPTFYYSQENPDDVYLDFNLSLPQYNECINAYGGSKKLQDSVDELLTNYISTFLQDDKILIINQVTHEPVPKKKCFLSNAEITGINFIFENNDIYTQKKVDANWEKQIETKEGYLSVINCKSKVVKWSPMLYLLYRIQNNTPSVTLLKKILFDTQLYPTLLYKSLTFDNDKKKALVDYTIFASSNNNPEILAQKHFITSDSPEGICYNSLLVPPTVVPVQGNPTAMCFDKQCTNETLRIFGLTDSSCKSECNRMKEWANDKSEASGIKNRDNLDGDRYKQICGEDINVHEPLKFNWGIFIFFTIIAMLCGILIFSICKKNEYTNAPTIAYTFSVFIIIFGISIFLGKDLSGNSMCDGNKFRCESSLTKVQIPDSFCEYSFNCETGTSIDTNCPPGCTTRGFTCYPINGKPRNHKQVEVQDMNYGLVILSILIFVIFSSSIYYLYQDYHWKIKWPLLIVVCLLSLIPLVYFIVTGLKKQKRDVFVGECIGDGRCNNDSDCDEKEKCFSSFCINTEDQKGCPISGKSPIPEKSLQDGDYIISYNDLFLTLEADKPAFLQKDQKIWEYNKNESMLYTLDSKNNSCVLSPFDVNKQSWCSGILYGKIYAYENNPKFILGNSTIFSINAQAFLIPDINNNITYSTVLPTSKIWKIEKI